MIQSTSGLPIFRCFDTSTLRRFPFIVNGNGRAATPVKFTKRRFPFQTESAVTRVNESGVTEARANEPKKRQAG